MRARYRRLQIDTTTDTRFGAAKVCVQRDRWVIACDNSTWHVPTGLQRTISTPALYFTLQKDRGARTVENSHADPLPRACASFASCSNSRCHAWACNDTHANQVISAWPADWLLRRPLWLALRQISTQPKNSACLHCAGRCTARCICLPVA